MDTVAVTLVTLLVVALGAGLAGLYNRLVRERNRYRNAFSRIDVALKRRYDLIPNLVETAQGYLRHERQTLEAVVQARRQAVSAEQAATGRPGDPEVMRQLATAEAGLAGALGRLFALAESYPDLKANQTMARLMEELTVTEEQLVLARQAYNDAATAYNTRRETFPAVLVAQPFGFAPARLWEIESAAEREAVKVSF